MSQDTGSRRAQARFQSGLLAWLRAPDQAQGLRDMVAVVRDLSLGDADPLLWRSAESFLAALLDGTLPADDEAKRLARRIERRLASDSTGDDGLRDALFAWISRRMLPASPEPASIDPAALPAAGLSPSLAATAELLPLLSGGRLPQRCSEAQLKTWHEAANALDHAWTALLRDGIDPCRKAATDFVGVALDIGDPGCLKLAEALAASVGCAEDPAWTEATTLRAAIAAALELARDRQGPNLPSFVSRSNEVARRLEQGEQALREARLARPKSGAGLALDDFVGAARRQLEAVAAELEREAPDAALLNERLGWFETQALGNSMAIRGLVVLWRESLAAGSTAAPERTRAWRQALAALAGAVEGLSLGRAPHPDIDAFTVLRALRRAAP